ncbi:MAG: Gfo/Idh/MocA family oxidoreductase [Methanomassiliicoccales archaeon]|nr:MAG: Gfo/Idh/MocA family oxidoreductase [Methanomassiliicoccales archaeon]
MVKIAVIGTGYWGRNHVRAFNELKAEGVIDELEICEVDEKRAREFSNIYHIPYCTNYGDLLKDDSLDGVSIATPTHTHFELAKSFMEAKKDVFVEKPMTTKSEDAEKLIHIAEDKKSLLMVGHIFRHHSAVKELKKRIERGDFGRIFYLTSTRFSFREPRKDMGVMFALAIHEVDIFCYLLNKEYPLEISAQLSKFLQKDIEEVAFLVLRFENDTLGYAFESWMTPVDGKRRDLTIIGSKMSAKVDYLKPQELQLFDASIISSADGASLKAEYEGSYTVPIPYKEPLKEEMRHFVECIKSREKPLSDMYAGKRAVEMIEIAFESARENKAMKIGK